MAKAWHQTTSICKQHGPKINNILLLKNMESMELKRCMLIS